MNTNKGKKSLINEKRVKLFGFVIMKNHIHLIWQMNEGIKREDLQRDFLKFTAQRIKLNLELNHPLVLTKFKVDLKDRIYQFWKRNPLSVDIFSEGGNGTEVGIYSSKSSQDRYL